MGSMYILSIDMVDVESAAIKLSERADVANIEGMLKASSDIASRFVFAEWYS